MTTTKVVSGLWKESNKGSRVSYLVVTKLTFTIVTIEDRQAQIIGYSFSGGFDKTFAFQVFRGENSRCDDFSGSLFDLKMFGNDVTNDNS